MQSDRLNKDKFIVFSITLGLLFLSYFQFVFGIRYRLFKEEYPSTQIYFFIIEFVLFLFFGLFHKQKNVSFLLWILGGYLVFVFIVSKPIGLSIFVSSLFLVFWVFCFSFGNRLSNTSKELSSYFIKMVNLIIILPLLLFSLFTFFTTEELRINQLSTDAFFSVVVYLPFVLMMKEKKALKTVLYVLIVVATIVSMKRSLIIGVIACSLIYLMLSEHEKVFFKWYFWILLVGIVFMGNYLYNIVSETLFYRFAQLEVDGGTGRDIIYKRILYAFQQSSLSSQLFGHGYQSVRLIIGKAAHNDFLQLLYDCGIIGAGLYIAFLLSMIVFAFRKYRKRRLNKTLYATFVSALLLYIVLASMNCFIYSPLLIAPLMLSLGLSRGLLKNNSDS